MRFIKKFLKWTAIIIVALVLIALGTVYAGHKFIFKEKTSDVPTIQPLVSGKYELGVQAHPNIKTVDDFVKVFAEQVKNYQKKSAELWPDNAVTNQYAMLESVEEDRFWLINPNGDIKEMDKEEALSYNISRVPYFNGFDLFEGRGIKGMYLAISKEDLSNYLVYQEYYHLGTYDVFITYSHESFHLLEQHKWNSRNSTDVPNQAKNDFYENKGARAQRNLLLKQLLEAVRDPKNQDKYVLDAIASFEEYKSKYPDDYQNSIYFDKVEGTAYYYELISCLYASYPEQIKNEKDLQDALTLLAISDYYNEAYGIISEGYNIGGFAGILLDRLEGDKSDNWKKEIIKNQDATPMQLLADKYKDEKLPEPVILSQADVDAVTKNINKQGEDSGPSNLFKMLYQLIF
ncbi:MAG: hypothetical protein LBN09_05530 [Clostridioides sp.]|jgi:hypothetical protein|nr:hypothetical protein [Clostridioides sp.]